MGSLGAKPQEVDRRKVYRRAYQARNRKLYSEAYRRWRERLRESNPEAFQALLDEKAANGRKWRKTKAGKLKSAAIQRQRRARKQGAEHALTVEQWESICERHADARGNVCCAYCSTSCEPTMDHVVPLARGGNHCESNVVPACKPCNSSKGAKLVTEWKGAKNYVIRMGIRDAMSNKMGPVHR